MAAKPGNWASITTTIEGLSSDDSFAIFRARMDRASSLLGDHCQVPARQLVNAQNARELIDSILADFHLPAAEV